MKTKIKFISSFSALIIASITIYGFKSNVESDSLESIKTTAIVSKISALPPEKSIFNVQIINNRVVFNLAPNTYYTYTVKMHSNARQVVNVYGNVSHIEVFKTDKDISVTKLGHTTAQDTRLVAESHYENDQISTHVNPTDPDPSVVKNSLTCVFKRDANIYCTLMISWAPAPVQTQGNY